MLCLGRLAKGCSGPELLDVHEGFLLPSNPTAHAIKPRDYTDSKLFVGSRL